MIALSAMHWHVKLIEAIKKAQEQLLDSWLEKYISILRRLDDGNHEDSL